MSHRYASRKSLPLSCLALAAVAFVLGTSGRAEAQPKPTVGVINLGEITIVGRVQKPYASVDVAKLRPRLTLAELKQPFLDRIEAALVRGPF